jgi:acyl-homoserine-lactone acylase
MNEREQGAHRESGWRQLSRLLLNGLMANAVMGTAWAAGHVSITTTEHGIPHIRADGFGSLGFGYGYAMARNDVCGMADMFLTMSGRRAEVIGEAQSDLIRLLGRAPIGNAVNDLTRRFLNDEAHLRAAKAALSKDLRQLIEGYAAGYNRYLRVTPSNTLPTACRASGTVRPITEDDVIRRVAGMAVLLGSGLVLDQIYAAEPPSGEASPPVKTASNRRVVSADAGSNAYAFGRDVTDNGSGMLLGNPHFFWDGPDRFVEMHLTIPGVYDAMGISQLGMPLIGVGFNDSLAWSHTVSADARALVYQLELDPSDPTRYRVDGRLLSMTKTRVSIPVLTADHRRATRQHTFWQTIYGSVLGGPDFPWTRNSAFAFADMNRDNHRLLTQWLEIGSSHSVKELKDRLQATVGLPWLNTIAADKSGVALFADISVTPNIDAATLKRCRAKVESPFDGLFVFVLGSDSSCSARTDASAPQAKIMPGAAKPDITRLDLVENSNESHWLVTPAMRLEGFSPIVGSEGSVRSFRTRQAMRQVADRLEGTDGFPAAGRLTPAVVRDIMMSGRSLQAELVVDSLLSSCRQESPSDDDAEIVGRACQALKGWDRHFALESRGAHLFAEFVAAAKDPDAEDLSKHAAYWSVPFSVSDPVNTPRGFKADAPGVREALLSAARMIEGAGLSLDARLRDIQFAVRNGQRIPLPGGATFSHLAATLQPNIGYTDPINPSNTYIQVVTFDADGPIADAILATSQTPDEASPFYMDQTQMYSRGEWVRLPFRPDAIEAGRVGPILELKARLR